jgi:hypothetical protein
MIPDPDKRLKDKMSEASLKDLMPGFDPEAEWQQLHQKLRPARKKIAIPVWAYAAAMLVLVAAGGTTWYISGGSSKEVATSQSKIDSAAATVPTAKDTNAGSIAMMPETGAGNTLSVAVAKKHGITHRSTTTIDAHTASGRIYNSTPCPIELCISQMMKCPNIQPKDISTCSTLEPDQSGQLNYKENQGIAKNCSLTVKEIEIRSLATGETILLNSISIPATAQEVFSYITKEKRGDVIAGVLNYDCDKKTRRHSLRLNNRDGNLIIE